jgi:hypothetical protein
MEAPKQIIKDFLGEHANEYAKRLHPWVSQTVTVSAASLTLLISFQKLYVPQNPYALWLLRCCWVLFLASVLAGIGWLHAYAQPEKRAVKEVLTALRRGVSDSEVASRLQSGFVTRGPKYQKFAYYVLVWAFPLALVFLFAFAWFNT